MSEVTVVKLKIKIVSLYSDGTTDLFELECEPHELSDKMMQIAAGFHDLSQPVGGKQ